MEHKCKLVVRYNECDMYGHVNHAVYLNYLEHARVELLKDHGISIMEMAKNGYRLFIVRVAIDYRNAAQFNDELEICTSPVSIKKVGGIFRQTIKAGSLVIVEADVHWACIDNTGRPVRIPRELVNLQQ